jgi:hypothetical protein
LKSTIMGYIQIIKTKISNPCNIIFLLLASHIIFSQQMDYI